MSTRQRKQSKLKPLLLPTMSILVLGYFAFHAVEGDYGLAALERLEARAAALEAELAAAKDERSRLERHVALMRPESLDADLVEERARQALNMVAPRDLVILTAPSTP